jgi:serine protease Do
MRDRRTIIYSAVLLVSLLAGFFMLNGCEKKSGKTTEYIGFPQSFADLAERVTPAVVNISTTTTVRIPGTPFRHFFGADDPFRDFFEQFFGDRPDREMQQQSLGSGFIIDKTGFIITNNHVVEGADEIKVTLSDGREFEATVIGRDPKTDLAVIKSKSKFTDLPVLSLGDSDKMRVGDWVLAIGNPFGLEHTVTQGILSATARVIGAGPYDNFLQTDAPINPGNSGGPLINLKAEVIGINTAIVAAGQGIGFAIPANMAKSIISQIKEKGKVTRGWIGVAIQRVTEDIARSFGLKEAKGALVSDVVPDGPADKAGIKRGDVIILFDGKEVKNMSDLPRIVADTPVDKTVEVKIFREGREADLQVTVEEMGEEKVAAAQPGDRGLGLVVDNITPDIMRRFGLRDQKGVIVLEVTPDGTAAESGIRPGDIILEVNRTPVDNVQEYESVMKKADKSSPYLFLVRRGTQMFYVPVQQS